MLHVVSCVELVLAVPAKLKFAHGAFHERTASIVLNEALAARADAATHQLVNIRHNFPLGKLLPLLHSVPHGLQQGLVLRRLGSGPPLELAFGALVALSAIRSLGGEAVASTLAIGTRLHIFLSLQDPLHKAVRNYFHPARAQDLNNQGDREFVFALFVHASRFDVVVRRMHRLVKHWEICDLLHDPVLETLVAGELCTVSALVELIWSSQLRTEFTFKINHYLLSE